MATRQVFSEAEKTCLQELIIKYKLNRSTTLASNPNAKKIAWNRLTEEFNSIETNTKRTENQLKKCWENLKTRQKTILNYEKRQRMMTGGGSYNPNNPAIEAQPGTNRDILIPEALSQQTDVELYNVIDSDTGFIPEEEIIMDFEEIPHTEIGNVEDVLCVSIASPPLETGPTINTPQQSIISSLTNRTETSQRPIVNTPQRTTISGLRINRAETSQGQRQIRTRVIQQEFDLRRETYFKSQEREDVLYKLQIKEKEWMVRAAEEIYNKTRIEREAAEEQLRCQKIKTEIAELELKNKK